MKQLNSAGKSFVVFAEKTLRIREKILCVQGLCKQWPFPQIPMLDFSFNSKPDITCMPMPYRKCSSTCDHTWLTTKKKMIKWTNSGAKRCF